MQAAHAQHVVQDDAAGEAGQEVGLMILPALEEEGDVEQLGEAADTTTSPTSTSMRISSTMRSGMRRTEGSTSDAGSTVVACDAVARLLRDI